ncbi:MAG TPA: HEAT repeat domain-containing protein [Gemmatimonadaceae bacterium]
MTSPSSPSASALKTTPNAPDAADAPFAPAPIEEWLRLIAKAGRAHQLYLPNNPIYRGAIDALRAGFRPIWQHTEEFSLAIGETDLRWYDLVVSGDSNTEKNADNLAWLLYKDGLREITIARGFEESEFVKLLEIIQRARHAQPDDDDLVAMMWEADFTYLKYRYVDLLHDIGGGEPADGTEAEPASPEEIANAAHQPPPETSVASVVNMADFDSTLYFLDEPEIEYLQGEIVREYQQDLRANVVAALFDIVDGQTDPAVRFEAIENVHTLMAYLLVGGHFRGAAFVLRESQASLTRAPDLTPEHRQRLAELPVRLSAPDTLAQLLQSLDDSPELPPTEDLDALFAELQATALATVFQWLNRTRNERLRPLLESAAERLAAANTAQLVKLIDSADPEVSLEAIRRSGGLKAQAAVQQLAKVLASGDVDRRQVAVTALSAIGSPGALQALERALDDDDREVRVGAARAYAAQPHRPAVARLEAAVKGKVRNADLTERMAFFEAYGAVAGDAGIALCDGILNGRGFLGRREDDELRACAAMALGRIGSPQALEALRKAAGEKDVVVRNAVTRALRGQTGAGQ